MQCQLKFLPQRESCFLLQFDRCLPHLFPQEEQFPFRLKGREPMRHGLFRPPAWRARHSLFLARINKGQVPFELCNPVETYRSVLDKLSATSGLTDLTDLDPYTLGVSIAGLFPPVIVCRQVAQILHEAFFPEEPLELLDGFCSERSRGSNETRQGSAGNTDQPEQVSRVDHFDSVKDSRCKSSSKKRKTGPDES